MLSFLQKIFLKEKNNESKKEKVLVSRKPKAKNKLSERGVNSASKDKKKSVAKVISSTTNCIPAKKKCVPKVKNNSVVKTNTNITKLKCNENIETDDTLSVEVTITPSPNALANKLTFRVNLDELQKLKQYVKDNHSTTSAVLRSLVQKITSSKRCTHDMNQQIVTTNKQAQILHELKRQGNNLNQSVRALNTLNKNINDEDKIQADYLLKELRITLTELQKMFALFI
ncbi:hypothetical protein [Colwellia piezophila]|uniref:hypothetical protein n=1 Tax=Colwellia piezophila TaxID=211668 RepID=UPI00037A7606|nr:hypothetical protein [Colwellia piezophila]